MRCVLLLASTIFVRSPVPSAKHSFVPDLSVMVYLAPLSPSAKIHFQGHVPAVFPNFQKFTQHPVFSYSKMPISRWFSNKQNSSLYFLCFRDVEAIIFLFSWNVNSFFFVFQINYSRFFRPPRKKRTSNSITLSKVLIQVYYFIFHFPAIPPPDMETY